MRGCVNCGGGAVSSQRHSAAAEFRAVSLAALDGGPGGSEGSRDLDEASEPSEFLELLALLCSVCTIICRSTCALSRDRTALARSLKMRRINSTRAATSSTQRGSSAHSASTGTRELAAMSIGAGGSVGKGGAAEGGDGEGGDGEGGGAEGGGAATTMIGADSTVIPSAVVAAVAVRRAAESVASTWVEVLEAGTAMVAVTITDAAVTAMLTACG
jgi:hypothetical protein